MIAGSGYDRHGYGFADRRLRPDFKVMSLLWNNFSCPDEENKS